MMDEKSLGQPSVKVSMKVKSDGEKSEKCNQCDFASSHVGSLKRHLETHFGKKSNKCNQCNYATFQTGNLRTHEKTHSGEKSKKFN